MLIMGQQIYKWKNHGMFTSTYQSSGTNTIVTLMSFEQSNCKERNNSINHFN